MICRIISEVPGESDSGNVFIKFIPRSGLIFLLIILLFSGCKEDPEPEITVPSAPDLNELAQFAIQQQPSSHSERLRLAKNLGAADFIPLGLMVKPGETIDVSLDLAQTGDLPSLLMGTYSRNDWTYTPMEFDLTEGEQRITNSTAESHLLYVRYIGDQPGQRADLSISGGWKVPFFHLGETSNEEFRSQLRSYKSYMDVQLMSERGIVVFARNIALKYLQQDWEALLKRLDEVVEAEEHISGLDGSSELHAPSRNKYFLTQTRDSRYWMAATQYRTFYNAIDAIDYVADLNKLTGDGWGPWHEIGHQHQLSAITWNETIEVTVNIYSLAVERAFGWPSRLKRENRWPVIMEYLNLPDEEKNYNDPSLGPFLRLGLYQQLWLAYGDEFFVKLHKVIREESASPQSREEKMGYLMHAASRTAGEDLREFFRTWGFQIDEQHYDAVASMGMPDPAVDIPALTD